MSSRIGAAIAFSLLCLVVGPLTIGLPITLVMGPGLLFYAYLFGGPVALAFSFLCWPSLLKQGAVSGRALALAAIASPAVLPLWFAAQSGGLSGDALALAGLWFGVGLLLCWPAAIICVNLARLLGIVAQPGRGSPT